MNRLTFTILLVFALTLVGNARADDRSDVIAAYMKAFQHKTYRLELRNMDGRGGTATVDVMMPDTFHMRSADGEFIVHPKGTWARQGGTWTRLPMDMTGVMQNYRAPTEAQAQRDIGTVVLVGDEMVEGCAARLYRYRSDSQDFGGGRPGQDVLLAVCKATGLPIRVQPVGEASSLIYDFGALIDIQPPE